jgi:hypothetical protein
MSIHSRPGPGRRAIAAALVLVAAQAATAQDRIASIGDTAPAAETAQEAGGAYLKLEALIRAMDRATHSSTRIVVRPFARSLQETAAGQADFHLPLAQAPGAAPPRGLVFVTEVDFGRTPFVIYSRKTAPLDADSVAHALQVEIEPGHESFFSFPVQATYCIPCSLDKILAGRSDALIVSSQIVDPLLRQDPRYKPLHRALFRYFPVRALVPAAADSAATRRYLVDGVARIKKSGELARIMGSDVYSDWQP